MPTNDRARVVFLDWLRVVACFMVILTHCNEPFYLGDGGTLIATRGDALWCTFVSSPLRVSIGLFVMASSWLLMPLRTDIGTFYRRRFVRVVIPFVLWSLLYALFVPFGKDGAAVCGSLQQLVYNLNMDSGHLWFVYMLVGVYLAMPVVSPWLERASEREERTVLIIWAFTTLVPFIRQAARVATGTTELWGEVNWNEFGTLYYISGYMGYVILAHYLKTHVPVVSLRRTLTVALPLWVVGYVINAGWYWLHIPAEYPVRASIDLAVLMEQSWRFCSLGVVMQTLAVFLVLRHVTAAGPFYRRVVRPLSEASYGMYLMHMFVLLAVFPWFDALCTPLHSLLTAVVTFVVTALLAVAVRRVPRVGKYVMGMVALLLIPATATAQDDAAALADSAMTCIERDELPEAEALLKQVIEADPAHLRNCFLLTNLGTVQRRQHRLEDAVESYTLALARQPLSVPILMSRAVTYLELGDDERAYTDLGNVLDCDAGHRDALLLRAHLAVQRHRYDVACADYSRLLSADLDDEQAQFGLAILNQKTGRLQEATDQLTRLVEAHPENPDYLQARADVYLDRSMADMALLDLDGAIELSPADPYLCVARAETLLAMGHRRDARAALDHAVALGIPRPQLQELYRQTGR